MWLLISLIVVGATTKPTQLPSFYAANDELRQYLLEAAERNPGLKAKYQEWQAALQRVPQVTTLDDPMFMYTQFVQSSQFLLGAGLQQMFPWFGTLRARGDKAYADAEAVLNEFYAMRNEIFAKVKRAYFEYALLNQNIEIVKNQAKVLDEVEELTRSRYALGLGTQADVLRVQVEKDRLDDQYKGLGQSKPSVVAMLLEELGREPAQELPAPQATEFPPPPPPAPVVLAQIRVANPNLAVAVVRIQSWEKEIVLAKKKGYPNFTVGLQYQVNKRPPQPSTNKMTIAEAADATKMLIQDAPMNGVLPTLGEIGYGIAKDRYLLEDPTKMKDDIMLSVQVNVPIWRKRIRAGIREAELMRGSTQDDKHRATLALDSAAQKALYDFQDALRRYDLYKDDVIPKTREIYENLRTYYAAGSGIMGETADFIDIQKTEQELLMFQLEQAKAARDLQVAAAELEMLMGGPWTGKETGGTVQVEKLAPPAPETTPAGSEKK